MKKKIKNTASEGTNYDEEFLDDGNSELDNFYQEVEIVKEELVREKEKVKAVKDSIKKKNKLIEALESQLKKVEPD